ncbi:MAG: CoB--CoM heterodisulfide reductase iron-sulfur subunit A family protein, partial [Desulfamplus sp.]|nr:CoB--CoM heterodisulfide reductase iron-sulfur subunit A family protein [Desulfamplus sp.]
AYTDLVDVKGEPGNFRVTLRKKARAVDSEKCVGCGICSQKCPVKVLNPFNLGLDDRKAIYILYPQVVPLVYTIDKERCRYFLKGKCGICQKFCENRAIEFDQEDEIIELDAGAVILAGGVTPFDARLKPEYGYGRWPNVVTSLEYERILSASGPFGGHIRRISDDIAPRRIAWIQCVGSRDIHAKREYCSSVCCMYATKQAMITKEHDPDIATTIFYIDIRAQGKGFDRYYERARTENQVRFIRSMVSRIVPNPENKTLNLAYASEDHSILEETFDMVVLSVGLCANPSATALARRLGLKIDSHGFCITDPLDMTATSRPGIFVCGGFQGPKDIPDSIQQGSGAANQAMSLIADARNTKTAVESILEERPVSGDEPRIGVFVCHCGINIAGVVDVEAVSRYALTLDNVIHAEHCMFACSTDQQQKIGQVIENKSLNRVVVASCTPRTHEVLFQNTLKKAGLNPYLFELANIREQDSWVHQKEPDSATKKAMDLVRMSVSRVRLLEPLHEFSHDVVQKALVVGGGLAGLTAAYSIAEHGFEAVIVEQGSELGGNARTLYYTEDDTQPSKYVEALAKKVERNPAIEICLNSRIVSISGNSGNFTTVVLENLVERRIEHDIVKNGVERKIEHGVVIVATGGEEYKPSEYLYGQHPEVKTQKEFESMLALNPDSARELEQVVMIQCVGSREIGHVPCVDSLESDDPQADTSQETDHMYCSRLCCTSAIKNSLKLKSINPDANISVLYRDIRTFGLRESWYLEARRQGVRFFQYDIDNKPDIKHVSHCDTGSQSGVSQQVVNQQDNHLEITVFDARLKIPVKIKADLLVLSAAIRPRTESQVLAEVMRLALDQDGFFLEAHPKLRPLDCATSGIFLCGLAQGPKFAVESIAQARGAVSRAVTILSKKRMTSGAVVNRVRPSICRACSECEKTCVFKAISVRDINGQGEKRAVVSEALCTGCGACNVVCPTGAASLAHFTDEQINMTIEAFA